jgi:hypothetical protein
LVSGARSVCPSEPLAVGAPGSECVTVLLFQSLLLAVLNCDGLYLRVHFRPN